jgi:hypothetical protein
MSSTNDTGHPNHNIETAIPPLFRNSDDQNDLTIEPAFLRQFL